MEFHRRVTIISVIMLLAVIIFGLHLGVSRQTKIQIIRYFTCWGCPHQDLQNDLIYLNRRIEEFSAKYPELDTVIEAKQEELNECRRKASANRLQGAREELESCRKVMREVINDMKLRNAESLKFGRVLEEDLDNYGENFIVD